jgi:signal transduction histidine kinase
MVLMTQLDAGILQREIAEARSPGQIWSVLTAAITLARRFAYRNPGNAIKVEEHTTDLMVRCHSQALRHALAELIVNALDFSPRSSVIEIDLGLAEHFACISITDRGPGIQPEVLEQIQADSLALAGVNRETLNAGLGFRLARRIIEEHDGQLICRTSLGVGTTLTIKIPVV